MKFCPHCGNPIKKKQSFCNKCGKHLKTSTQRKSENQIEHMREQQSYISREERQHHDSTFYKEQKHTGWLIVLSIIFVLLIAALLYGAYYTYNHYISDEQSHQTTQSQQSNESDQNRDQSTGPSIDVFSDDFDQGYMKSASTSGYRGVYNGMTREEVEDKFGTSNGSVESLKWSYETYGDLAVAYDDNEVVSVGVAPNHISEDQFLSMYNEPDDRNSSQLIYDSNKDNDFSVLANVKNGDVTVIENVNQI